MTAWQFTDATNLVASRTFADGSQECRIASALSPEDLAAVLPAASPTAAVRRTAIDVQIAALEAQQLLPRITRETLLAIAVSTAAAQGITEPQLYAAQTGYKRLKDFDASISVLRVLRDSII